jgi:hypothetical protein
MVHGFHTVKTPINRGTVSPLKEDILSLTGRELLEMGLEDFRQGRTQIVTLEDLPLAPEED